MEKHGKAIQLRAILDSENGGSPQPFFQPKTLFDAIVLQFFEDVTTGTKLRLCAPAAGSNDSCKVILKPCFSARAP